MSESLINLLTIAIPTIATIVANLIQLRINNRHSAKQSIFQMIIEDHVSVQEGKLPSNYQNILREYDAYHQAGGNSYVTEKVEDYKKWYLKIHASKEE